MYAIFLTSFFVLVLFLIMKILTLNESLIMQVVARENIKYSERQRHMKLKSKQFFPVIQNNTAVYSPRNLNACVCKCW